ncbi:MAG TPA: PEP-CTERM sorting domain-containing protein [Verrucomicrobiae bacterium]|jgi:hypothetical protein|nr:PEP-CTERM sorting domain-containing protein [Verrucomicrobiae bacterium]
MKNILIVLVIGLLSQISALSQGTVNFNIDFGANPPPHTPGDPFSGATLTGDVFSSILYLDTTVPISGSIEELDGGTFTTVFQFSNLVFATYPGGGPANDYEDSRQLTDNQIQNLLAGKWYANVTYSGASYTGQITPVPEPSSITLFLASAIMIWAGWRRRIAG